MQAKEYERLDRAEEKLWWFRALRLFLRRLLPVAQGGQRALDIGCGTGGLLRQLIDTNYETSGIDLSNIALGFARRRAADGLAQGSANQLPFLAAAFDLVTCVDLLEVVSVEPGKLVAEALRVLKPGGKAVFVMAAHQWLLSEHDRAVSSVRRYNVNQMRALFAKAGIEIQRDTYLFFFLFPLVAVRKLFNRPKKAQQAAVSDVSVPPAIINSLLFVVCWFEAQLLRVLNLPLGSSVLVMVKKIA
jgi:ubiquinone/menaquinone biosynthesis C-methylase UbiE